MELLFINYATMGADNNEITAGKIRLQCMCLLAAATLSLYDIEQFAIMQDFCLTFSYIILSIIHVILGIYRAFIVAN